MIFDELDELGKLQLVEASVNLGVKSRWFSVTFHDDSLKSTHWVWDDVVKSPINQQDSKDQLAHALGDVYCI